MKKQKILLPLDASNANTPWLWLGTWSMGGEGFGRHDERESLRVLHSAVENNIRHFDTAGFYAHGKSERLMKKIIKSERKEFFISSKGGLVWKGRQVEHRASPEELKKQLNESLERLETDYLDLYQMHWPDPGVPLQESIDALKEFQKEGLIRFWGVGNLTAKQISDYLSKERNIHHQVHFNPLHQDGAVLNTGSDCCINCAISPLEQGLLGKDGSSLGKAGIGKNDVRNRNPYFSNLKVMSWNNRLDKLIKQYSISKVSLIFMWICSQPHVHAIIPGPRKLEQLDEILRFKSEVEKHGLLASDESDSILSEDKVKNLVPDELWEHLADGVLE
jgi:aryl-alcohol dehydrogenase-like predicted oxidoreductase